MARFAFQLSSIKAKIITMLVVGLLGMVFIAGVNVFEGRQREKEVSIGEISAQSSAMGMETMMLEEKFINTMDNALLSQRATLRNNLKSSMEDIKRLSDDEQILNLVEVFEGLEKKHDDIFSSMSENLERLNQAKEQLAIQIANIKIKIKDITATIDTEETNLMMEGEVLSSVLQSVRNQLKDFLALGYDRSMNLGETLMLYSKKDEYLTAKEKLEETVNLAVKNTGTIVNASGNKEYITAWQEILNHLKEARQFEDLVYQEWVRNKELMPELAKNTAEMQKAARDITQRTNAKIEEVKKTGRYISWGAVTAGILILASLGFFVYRAISGPITQTINLANTIKRGDLSQRLNSKNKDEIGLLAGSLDAMADGLENKDKLAAYIADGDLTHEVDLASNEDSLGLSLKKMQDNLNNILGQIKMAAAQVDSGSRQVADSSQALSQGATEQAASLEEVTSSMTELANQTKGNAENAAQANNLSINARDDAEQGNIQMNEMSAAMDEINESSREIAKIIKTIDDIAFQTNLLALNAAVEAARAGKHGKGFAVVAQEVRNLAGRSAKAANETAEMIENSIKKVEVGVGIVQTTADSLQKIVEGATKAADLVGEIAAASNEQADGFFQINQGLSQIERVTQQNTASAEQTASASEQLSSQATEMMQLIRRFKLLETGVGHYSQRESVTTAAGAPRQIEQHTYDGWGQEEETD